MKATEHGPRLASLQELVDSVPALIHTARPDGYIDFFNQQWLEFVGRRLEDLEGWKWTAVIHPDDVDALVARWRACLASGEPFELESRVRRADGAYRWMWHHKLPLRDASGEIVKWYGSSVDIDDRKQAEFYLAEGQRLGHTGSWAFNADGFDYWSPELFAIHGLTPGGKAPTIAEYMALVHPEDRGFVAQEIQRMLSDHRGFDFTKRIVRPDGDVRYVRCVGAPVIEGGPLTTIVGTAIDVTEHELLTQGNRRREAYLAEAQRLSHTGSFGWNVSTDEYFWSDETFRIFEFDPSSKVSLPMILECVHPRDMPAVKEAIAAATRAEGIDLEIRILMPDGRIKHLHVVGKARKGETGTIEVIGAVMDVTARKLTEVELRRSKAHLTDAQRLSHVGGVGMEASTKRIFWSEESARIYGYAPGTEPTPDLILQRVHPEDVGLVKVAIERAGRGGDDFDFEHRLLMPDGSVKHIYNLSHCHRDEAGNAEVVGAIMDVTERRVAEEAIRRSEAYLAEAQRLSHTGSFGWKPDSGEIVWSAETYRIFGYDEGIKPTLDLLMRRVHPEDRAEFQRVVDAASGPAASQFEHTYRLLLPGEIVKHVHALARRITDAFERHEFVGAVTDVTEHKRAEEALRESEEQLRRSQGFLLEAQRLSHTASWRHDLSTGAVTTSPEMLRMWGVRPEEDSSAIEFWFDRIHPDDRLRVQGTFADSEREKRGYEADYRILLPDGAVRYHHSVGHPVVNESGDLSEFVGTALDVTEQWQIRAELEKANRALREREADLLEAQRLTHAGSWRHDVSLGTVSVTPEVHRIFAISPDEDASTADFFFNRIHPEDRAAEFDNYAQAQQTKRDFQSDYRILLPDGSVRHIHNIGHPVLNASDEITAFLGTMRDVTEQVEARTGLEQASAALRETEAKARLIVDGIDAQVVVNTPDGEVEFVNQRVLDYFGKTLQELKSWRTTDAIHPEDRSRVIAAWRTSIETGQSYDADYRIRRSDGVYRWFHARARALRGADGAIARWYVLLTDIEERKTAEQRLKEQEAELRQILDLSSQLVGVLGPARERLYLNHTGLEYLGVGLDEWRQRAPGLSIHPEDVGRLYAHADRAAATGSADEVEVRVRKHDGSYRWFHVRFNPVRDDQGQITKWYWACTDIEDRKRAQERLEQENVALREEIDKASMFEEIVGASPALEAVLKRVARVARTESTVLITGETGTGKELVARAIHRRSARGGRAFITLNCAAVPRELIASELFGHEKGAFTGAMQRRLGRFELAHGGTIFLDEIGELPMETQVALLRVLQEHEFERIGGSASIQVDVRVIAATNRDLQSAIEAGTFRSDLFYRLNVFPITVPPLRERADDIPVLVEYFIDRYARKAGKTIRRVNKRTLERLQSYPWPGNVRELQNVIERSVIVSDTDEFTVDDSWLSAGPTGESRLALPSTLAGHEKAIIEDALRASGGRVFGPSGAAARLGIARSTLESKIRTLGINKNRFRGRPAKP